MNAVARAALVSEPVPVTNGLPASACVVRVGGRWFLAWLVGTSKEPFGEPFPTARDAAKASIYLNERATA